MADERKIRKLRKKLEKALEKGREEEAIETLSALQKEEPKVPRWAHKQGDLLRKANKRSEAVKCYVTAVELYADSGFIARAIAMAKTILTLDPGRIDILERVDPDAARALHRAHRPGAVSDRPGDALGTGHPMILDDDAPAVVPRRPPPPRAAPRPPPPPPSSKRHPMVEDDEPVYAPPAPKRHPMVIGDDEPAYGSPEPKHHPMVIDDAPGRAAAPAPTHHPMVIDDGAYAAPPPAAPAPQAPALDSAPHASAAAPQRPGRQLSARRHITLEKLSIPVPSMTAVRTLDVSPAPSSLSIPHAPNLPDIDGIPDVYDAVNAEELEIAPDVGPHEVRFSNAPPAMAVGVDVTADEFGAREITSEHESLPPEPSAARLSRLPLFPLFAEVPREALADLVRESELIELPDGALVMRKGDPADALYGIIEGSVGVVVPGQQVTLTLAEGDVFGESCLLAGEQRHADVVVQGRLSALRIPTDVLARLFKAHQRLAEVLLELLTRRLLGNLLQSSALFAEFDADGRRDLAGLFEIRRARRGIFLAEAGKKMDGLYINLTGSLEITNPGGATEVVGAGNMFGQNAILSEEPSRVTIRTASNMVVLRLTQQAFTQVAMQYPTILAHVAELAQSEVVKIST